MGYAATHYEYQGVPEPHLCLVIIIMSNLRKITRTFRNPQVCLFGMHVLYDILMYKYTWHMAHGTWDMGHGISWIHFGRKV